MINIEEGRQYLLDGKIVVTIIKAITRSRSSFSVALPDKQIEIISKERLTQITALPQ